MSIICGHCRLPIANGETGVRHFGHYVAHTENRCVSLLSAEIERLRARVAELEQDAKRYRYLSGQIKSDPDMSGNHRWWRLQPYQQLRGPTIHDAIDAALAKGGAL